MSPPRTQQLRLRENQLFLILTIVIGILAGLAAVLFTVAIEQTSHRLFGLAPSRLRLFAVPPLMSIVTGFLLAKVFPDVRGSGVPQTEAAYHLSGGVIPGHVPLGKFLTGVLCIGSGHSMGREGPSVQIGAGLASAIGRWLHLSPQRVRDLVPVGAAGALAAAFNTPVAAVLFALEEIIGDMNASLLGSTVVASVAAVVVERSILGNEPLFHVPTYRLVHPAELLAYAALGVIGGIVSLIFCKALLALRHVFSRLPQGTKVFQPAIGGLVIGAILVYSPAVMGVGYDYVDQALNGGLLLKTMAILCCLKLGATIVSYASGNAGGIFAPSLYIGAMAGGAVGTLVHRVAPFPTGDPGAYALVGHGHAVRGNHSRTDDVGLHDLRNHTGLSDPGAADGRQHAQLRDLPALSACACVSRPPPPRRRAPSVADRADVVPNRTPRHAGRCQLHAFGFFSGARAAVGPRT